VLQGRPNDFLDREPARSGRHLTRLVLTGHHLCPESPLSPRDGPPSPTVVGQNPPASSDRQHEEPGGSRDYWWAPVPRSTARDPAHDLASGLLGVPPDLVPVQEGIIC
jgi:hypothetical protein